jgi:anti-sigma factor RsiW
MTSQTGREREPSPLEEELVAYLDDELDDDARRRLERRLADEPTVRESLRKLTRVWDALERLPRAEVSDSFATTTVEAVVLSENASQANSLGTQFRGKRDWWLKRGVALAACVLVSFVAVSLFWPDPNQQLAEDLPILQNLAAYRHIESIEFLKLLAKENLFPKDEETPVSAAAVAPTTAGALTLIASMPEGERAAVARSRQEFAKIPSEEERAQLRALEKALSQEPDQAELRRVLARYGAWLKTINGGQSSQLSDLKDPALRAKRDKEILEAD